MHSAAAASASAASPAATRFVVIHHPKDSLVRIVSLAAAGLAIIAAPTLGLCDKPEGIRFSASEISNIWKYCSVSGRATAAILECFHQQTDKLGQAKEIQRNNQRMEALTRQEVGVPAEPAQ